MKHILVLLHPEKNPSLFYVCLRVCFLDNRGGDRADHVGAGVQGGCPRAHLGQQR